MENNIYDFIIIGGGISGVTIGNKLYKKYKNILLLESKNRLGGRIYSKKINDNYIEFGAKWVHGNVPHFKINGLEYFYEKYDNKIIQKFKIVDQKIPSKKIDKILTKYSRLKIKNSKDRYCNLINFSEDEKNTIDIIFSEDFGERICNLSYSNNDFKIYKGKNKRIINGFSNIDLLKAKCPCKLNSKVIDIVKIYIDNKVIYKIFTKDKCYFTKRIIFAIPLTILKDKFLNLLSEKKIKILEKLDMGKVNILALFFDKIFWNINTVYWFSHKYPNILFINGGKKILYIKEYSKDSNILKNYEKYIKYYFPNYIKPIKIISKNWNKDKDIKGSWTYHKKNIKKSELKYLKKGENNIFLTGEHTSHNRWGTVDGAYESAIQVIRLNNLM